MNPWTILALALMFPLVIIVVFVLLGFVVSWALKSIRERNWFELIFGCVVCSFVIGLFLLFVTTV